MPAYTSCRTCLRKRRAFRALRSSMTSGQLPKPCRTCLRKISFTAGAVRLCRASRWQCSAPGQDSVLHSARGAPADGFRSRERAAMWISRRPTTMSLKLGSVFAECTAACRPKPSSRSGLERLYAAISGGKTLGVTEIDEAAWRGEHDARQTHALFTRGLAASQAILPSSPRGAVSISRGESCRAGVRASIRRHSAERSKTRRRIQSGSAPFLHSS